MTRKKRMVAPGLPHHITQRGCRKEDTFFDAHDREVYLNLLEQYSAHHNVQVISYCLMTNHIHLLAVPEKEDSLRWALQLTHKRYAEYANAKQGWTGHLWQAKFYSSPVDDTYFWAALRYIERNPVEASLVDHPAKYRWSSAADHCGGKFESRFLSDPKWIALLSSRSNWYEWLSVKEDEKLVTQLKKNTRKDLPCGSDDFLDRVERDTGLPARPAKIGRKLKTVSNHIALEVSAV